MQGTLQSYYFYHIKTFPCCIVTRQTAVYLVLFGYSGAAKAVAAGLLTVSGGIGGTIIYAKWDPKFRGAVEKNIPYSQLLLDLALGPAPQDAGPPFKKQVSM